jgi:hypothetical protein
VLRKGYPYLDRNRHLKRDVYARLKGLAWMALKGFTDLYPGYRALQKDAGAQQRLGFRVNAFPCYDTFRVLQNNVLNGILLEELLNMLLEEQVAHHPQLGEHQAEDATPLEARRRDRVAHYNPHYGVRMYKLDLRWDIHTEALLTQQFTHGLGHEGHHLPILTQRLEKAGVNGLTLTVDNNYVSFHHIALQWRHGTPLQFKPQQEWQPNPEKSHEGVLKRYQKHWRHPQFLPHASLEAKLRWLIDHGTPNDLDAVGRYLRDHQLHERTETEQSHVQYARSRNEALNHELKRLPWQPTRKGIREAHHRANLCCLFLHMVQITRLQNGVRTGLCLTAHIL